MVFEDHYRDQPLNFNKTLQLIEQQDDRLNRSKERTKTFDTSDKQIGFPFTKQREQQQVEHFSKL